MRQIGSAATATQRRTANGNSQNTDLNIDGAEVTDKQKASLAYL
jgi:hypothetical protein